MYHRWLPMNGCNWIRTISISVCSKVPPPKKKHVILTSLAKEPSLPPFLEMLGLFDHKALHEDVFPVNRDLLSHVSAKKGWQNSDPGHKHTWARSDDTWTVKQYVSWAARNPQKMPMPSPKLSGPDGVESKCSQSWPTYLKRGKLTRRLLVGLPGLLDCKPVCTCAGFKTTASEMAKERCSFGKGCAIPCLSCNRWRELGIFVSQLRRQARNGV